MISYSDRSRKPRQPTSQLSGSEMRSLGPSFSDHPMGTSSSASVWLASDAARPHAKMASSAAPANGLPMLS